MNRLVFGGADLSQYGLIAEAKVDGAPARDYEEVVVAGKNGILHIDNGRYDNCEQIYNCVIYKDYVRNVRALRNVLCSKIGYQRLEDGFNPDEYYMAVYKVEFEPSQTNHRDMGTVQLVFERKPQRFLKLGETPVTFTANGKIYNPTEFEAKPLLKFTRNTVTTGTISIGIGGSTITFTDTSASEVIYMDCETMEAWSLSGTAKISKNANVQLSGNSFPVLHTGENGVAFNRGIASVEITPRWWSI